MEVSVGETLTSTAIISSITTLGGPLGVGSVAQEPLLQGCKVQWSSRRARLQEPATVLLSPYELPLGKPRWFRLTAPYSLHPSGESTVGRPGVFLDPMALSPIMTLHGGSLHVDDFS